MGGDEPRERSRKRRRVAVACDECRRRKIRCDGLQPFCSFCLDHRRPCVYNKGSPRVQVPQDHLDSLVRQVEELRGTNAQLRQQVIGAGIAHDSGFQEQGMAGPSECNGPATSPAQPEASVPPPSFPSPSTTTDVRTAAIGNGEAVQETSSVTDTILCTGSPPPATGSGYFGASSTPAFLETVQTMTLSDGAERAGRLRLTGRRTDRMDRSPVVETGKRPSAFSIKSRLLPPRPTADHLMETYFTHVCVTFTILQEATFREEYDRLWQPGSPQPDCLWLCILNGVFALASLFSDQMEAQESESTAETFFLQAKELYNFENLDYGSLAMVQALLLMGHYLHIKRVSRCWHIFGLAIRIAQGLGLHSSNINSKYGTVERETRKRCWCGCLVMDTMLAMTFGRPMMIPSEYYYSAEMPASADDTRTLTTPSALAWVDGAKPPKILLFISRVKLCIILHSILRTLYQTSGDDEESAFRAGDMVKLDQQLSAWLNDLPEPMRMRDPADETVEESLGVMPGHVLYTRYLAARILLTRPSLAVVARGANSPPAAGGMNVLDHSFALCTAEACIDTSKRLIDHIRTSLPLERQVLGSTWHNTNCVFGAALVLFVAQIIPALRSRVADKPHWRDCFDLMRSLARRCISAQACLSMLESLDSHLTHSQEQQDIGLEEMRWDFSDFRGLSPSIIVPDWADSFGIDELLL